MGRMDKTHHPTICCLQEAHFRSICIVSVLVKTVESDTNYVPRMPTIQMAENNPFVSLVHWHSREQKFPKFPNLWNGRDWIHCAFSPLKVLYFIFLAKRISTKELGTPPMSQGRARESVQFAANFSEAHVHLPRPSGHALSATFQRIPNG